MKLNEIEAGNLAPTLFACAVIAPLIMFGLAGALTYRAPSIAVALVPGYAPALAVIAAQRKQRDRNIGYGDADQPTDANWGPSPLVGNFQVNSSNPGSAPAAAQEVQLLLPLGIIESLSSRVWRTEPLNGDAIRALGYAKGRSGDKDAADRLFALAIKRSQRDHIARFWLIKDAIARQDFDDVLIHLDMLYRTKYKVRTNIITAFAAMADNPKGRKSIVAALKNSPPWRQEFLSTYPRIAKNLTSPMKIFVALQAAGAELNHKVVHVFSRNLLNRGFVDQAYYAWLQTLTPEQLKQVPFLDNGDFEAKITSSPFSWQIFTSSIASTNIVKFDDSAKFGKSLQVMFFGERVNFRHVRQITVLTPGKYRMSGSFRLFNLNSSRGLVWRISCVAKNSTMIGESKRMRGHSRVWASFEFEFLVPEKDCTTQDVYLILAARNGPESISSGRALFDRLMIERQ